MAPFVLLATYAAGILLAAGVRPESLTVPAAAAGLLLTVWLVLRRSRWGWLPFILAVLLTGYLNALLAFSPPSGARHISRFADNSPRIIEARIVALEPRATGGFRLQAEGHRIVSELGEAEIFGRLQLTIEEGTLTARPGQIVRWRGKLRRPARFGNPGEFDFPLHLAARGIYVTGFMKSADELVVIVNHPDRVAAPVENLRLSLAARIAQVVPYPDAGLVQSLLLGMRGGISDTQRTILAESGVAHLFAISGLHFGLLALLLYQVGRRLYTGSRRLVLWCPPQRLLPVLLIIPLAGYLLLTGDAWATRRAFLMAAIAALLFAVSRRIAPLALLATVALLMLLINPLALFQPGFQLSFAGLTGILAWLPSWQKRLADRPAWLRWPAVMVMTTIAATLTTAPATLWHFHLIAPGGLFANLIAIPLVAWGAVPAGLAGIALLPVCAPLAELVILLSAWLTSLAVDLAAITSQWPGLRAVSHTLTPGELILAVSVLLILLIPAGWQINGHRLRIATLTCALVLFWLVRPAETGLRVIALSVGQGDATLVSLNGDDHYLIDGGGLAGTEFDPGERLVAPALGRLGVRRLKGVVLTHNHPDHSSGLTHILQHYPVEYFLTACDPAQLAPELRQALREKNIPLQKIAPGWQTITRAADRQLSLFAPSQEAKDINERTILVYAGDGHQGALLTGDLGRNGFSQTLAAGLPGPVTLLKLPHHGSRHAAPAYFLDNLEAQIAFASAGRFNPYGFPHSETLAACDARATAVYRTDLQGMLTFRLRNGSWSAESGPKGFIID